MIKYSKLSNFEIEHLVAKISWQKKRQNRTKSLIISRKLTPII